jgi:hypothetical protein
MLGTPRPFRVSSSCKGMPGMTRSAVLLQFGANGLHHLVWDDDLRPASGTPRSVRTHEATALRTRAAPPARARATHIALLRAA